MSFVLNRGQEKAKTASQSHPGRESFRIQSHSGDDVSTGGEKEIQKGRKMKKSAVAWRGP